MGEIFQMSETKFKELKAAFDLCEDEKEKEKGGKIEIPLLDRATALLFFKFKLQLSADLINDVYMAELQGKDKGQEMEYFGPAIMRDKFFMQSKMEMEQFDIAMQYLK